ncbi:phosphotransferase family protein [Paraburkholderia flagellata]|uniref:phosphotransferase family protein n=1 Tax=Paraburkholderia flagellata TaxID=2883241 RepID=UPI001F2500B0|nr:phosphotransferase family protein [Paraburkholderia flagellata]
MPSSPSDTHATSAPARSAGLDLERLADWMRQTGSDPRGLSARVLSGGQSNPTFLLQTASGAFVLRKQPPGVLLPSAHAIDREYRVMQALEGSGVPVPHMVAFCDDASLIGTPFFLMEYVRGRSFIDPTLPDLAVDERKAIYADINRVLVALHSVDYRAAGLDTFGRPGNYFARQIDRWSRQYRGSEGAPVEAMDALMKWLPAHIPEGDETCVVHGDMRMDNLIIHPTEPKVVAVLDWELSTLGHPLADLSYFCMSWCVPPDLWRGVAGVDLTGLGIPQEHAFVEDYCRARGIDAIQHWDFYLAYNLFRMAAILRGVASRAAGGNAAAADAASMEAKVRPLAELSWRCARRSGT